MTSRRAAKARTLFADPYWPDYNKISLTGVSIYVPSCWVFKELKYWAHICKSWFFLAVRTHDVTDKMTVLKDFCINNSLLIKQRVVKWHLHVFQ